MNKSKELQKITFPDLYYVVGACLLFVVTIFALYKINWGYVFFGQILEDTLRPLNVNTSLLLNTPMGRILGFSEIFAHILNTILIVLFTTILIVSTYYIFFEINLFREKVSALIYIRILCAIVFLCATYIIMHWAVLIFNGIPLLESMYTPGPIDMRQEMPYPFMTYIQPQKATFWFYVILYFVLNFLRVVIAGFFAKKWLSNKHVPGL